jgi:hypothetical protein
MTARELVAKKMPPIRMIVGGYVPAGLLLLAGDPKVGKSLLMQDLAVSVATGVPAWGSLDVEQGDVLYLANEGGEQSFRDRLVKMLHIDEERLEDESNETEIEIAPSRLFVTKTTEPLGERLEVQIEWWLSEQEDPRLVVIDTYSSVAPEARGVNRHQDDYNALAGLADLATRWRDTLFVVVHHTRKAEGDDIMHRISGSNGMGAATDGMAVLTRHVASRQCVLNIRPRNAEESELMVERGPDLRWSVVGEDETSQLSQGRQAILAYLKTNPEGASPKMAADALGLEQESVRQYLTQMAAARQIDKPRRGWYRSIGDVGEGAE